MKEAAYNGMVRPILEYRSSVWGPYAVGIKAELEKVRNRAARFETRNYTREEGSMTGILEQLKLESLMKKGKDNRLLMLYKCLKGKARKPTYYLVLKTRCCRNQYSMAFQTPDLC